MRFAKLSLPSFDASTVAKFRHPWLASAFLEKVIKEATFYAQNSVGSHGWASSFLSVAMVGPS